MLALVGCEGEITSSNFVLPGSEQHETGGPGAAGSGRTGDGPGVGSSDDHAAGADDDTEGGATLSCDMPTAAPAPLRRLTDVQYRNSVREIFGGVLTAYVGLPASQPNLGRTGFTAEADANAVSERGAEQIADAAEALAVQVVDQLAALLPCYPASQDTACAQTFVDTYAPRAFRRPLEDAERDLLLSAFANAGADLSFAERLGVVSAALLQLPQFLYQVERGQAVADQPQTVPLTGYEIASRLSFLFWDSSPDAELLAAATAGELDTAAGIETHARRLVGDQRAHAPLRRFFREWMQLPELSVEEKDASVYPTFDAELAQAFDEELDRYLDAIIANPDATPADLLSSSAGWVNAPLASFYGATSDSTGPDDWQPMSEMPADRAGLLGRPALLAGLAYPGDSAPIHRGKFVLTRLLCVELPSPPADALSRQPVTPPGSSQRERSLVRREIAECAGCHDLMDPIGLGLEQFDGIGQLRDRYPDGSAVDSSGEIRAAVDVQGEFEGAAELGALLAQSDDVRACMAKQWLRYAMSRVDTREDACSLDALRQDFADADHSLRELFVAVTRTDAFRFRRVEVEE